MPVIDDLFPLPSCPPCHQRRIRQYGIDLYDIRFFPDVRHGHFCCSQHLLLMADGAADTAFCHQRKSAFIYINFHKYTLLYQVENHPEQCRQSQTIQCNGERLPQKDDYHKLFPCHVRRSGEITEKIIRCHRQKDCQCK